MYWSDWGNHPKIETAAMDGTLRETLVEDNIQWPTGPWRQGSGGVEGAGSQKLHKSWGGKGSWTGTGQMVVGGFPPKEAIGSVSGNRLGAPPPSLQTVLPSPLPRRR